MKVQRPGRVQNVQIQRLIMFGIKIYWENGCEGWSAERNNGNARQSDLNYDRIDTLFYPLTPIRLKLEKKVSANGCPQRGWIISAGFCCRIFERIPQWCAEWRKQLRNTL